MLNLFDLNYLLSLSLSLILTVMGSVIIALMVMGDGFEANGFVMLIFLFVVAHGELKGVKNLLLFLLLVLGLGVQIVYLHLQSILIDVHSRIHYYSSPSSSQLEPNFKYPPP